MLKKNMTAMNFFLFLGACAFATEKLNSVKTISGCKLDCAYFAINYNSLTLFGFGDQTLLKKNFELVSDKIRKEFKTRSDGNAFDVSLNKRLKDQVLKNAGITERNKIFIQIIEPKLKKMALTSIDIKSLIAGVNLFDTGAVPGKIQHEPALNTIDLKPVGTGVDEESHGIAYIGERDPGFKNFGRITFTKNPDLFTKAEIESELDKSIYTKGLRITLGKVSTMQFGNNNLMIYKIAVPADAKIGTKSHERREIEAYFLKTRAGFFVFVPFDASFRSYFNPIRYIYYGETDSAKFVSVDTYNAFEASQIIKVGDGETPEVILGKMGYFD